MTKNIVREEETPYLAAEEDVRYYFEFTKSITVTSIMTRLEMQNNNLNVWTS